MSNPSLQVPLPCEECLPYSELKTLYDISRIMGSSLEIVSALEESLLLLQKYLQLEKCTVYEIDLQNSELKVLSSIGLTKAQEQKATYKIGEGATGLAAKSKEPIIVENIHNNITFLNKSGARDREDISYIAVPIISRDTLLGVLGANLTLDSRLTLDETMKILTIVSSIFAQAKYIHKTLSDEKSRLSDENRYYKDEILHRSEFETIIGNSPKMKRVFEIINRVASSKATVLIRGETGTGKELIASAIHKNSPRVEKPYIKLNCAAIPEALLESELFGHEKGAFTDAKSLRKGRFELAHGGTLFLDEIGDISPSLQVKLLRVLQEQEFERIGGSSSIKVDVRIIAATNRNLEVMVEEGDFREDLFYRLNVIPIELPPLRERRDDVSLLVIYFLDKFKKIHNKELDITPAARELLSSYSWPGNIRELQNSIERVVLFANGEHIDIDEVDIMLPYINKNQKERGSKSEEPKKLLMTKNDLQILEREAIIKALQECHGVRIKAAQKLGMSNRQIGYKIKKHNIEF